MPLLDKLKRTTSSSFYLPQLDGLRFLAIFIVVVQMHITHYIDEKFFANKLFEDGYWKDFILEGINGVYLFFVISGFILGLPFAKSFILKESKVDLKRYYLRRLVRLEPPYILALILSFIASVWILEKYSFETLLPHFFASLFYSHNWIYGNFSWVLPVAWTLESEVQFYILSPLLSLVYLIRAKILRWTIFGFVIILSIYLCFNYWKGIGNLAGFIFFFYGGMFLADLYVNEYDIKNQRLGLIIGIISLFIFIFLLARINIWTFYLKYFALIAMVYMALTNDIMKKFFSIKVLTVIGGMCYSIYLCHFAIISAMGSLLLYTGINLNTATYILFYFIYFITGVLIISGIYFYFIEKPFMNMHISYWKKKPK